MAMFVRVHANHMVGAWNRRLGGSVVRLTTFVVPSVAMTRRLL